MNTAFAATEPVSSQVPEAFWRSLGHLNSFRVFLAIALGVAGLLVSQSFHRFDYPRLFQVTCAIYLMIALLFRRPVLARREGFERQARHVHDGARDMFG